MTRLPALPLITADPYFSVWMPADKLTDTDTAHWCGTKQPICGFATIDGQKLRFLGTGAAPAMPTSDISVTPCTTRAEYKTDTVGLSLSFTMPILPGDLDRSSTPICLIDLSVCSLDRKPHTVQIDFEFTDELCWRGEWRPEIAAYPMKYPDLNMMSIGRLEQKLLCHSGDSITIDWGYLYLGSEGGELCYNGKALCLTQTLVCGEQPARMRTLAGYDDIASILYFGLPCKAWYARNGKTFPCAMRETRAQFDELQAKCAAVDERIQQQAREIGGEDYELITSAAYRQVFAAHKLIADGDGNMVFISKENNSNGCAGTVDVSYPSTPMLLQFFPELVNAICRPVLRFAKTDVWSNYDFAPHDVGRYPIINGQVYGADRTMDVRRKPAHQPPYYLMPAKPERYSFRSQMPVEESGNMLIMLYAAAQFTGDTALVQENLDLCEKWVQYLIDYGEDPGEQLCTDDFAGHLAHNVNLSAKAIVGIACYGRLLQLLGKDGSKYQSMAKSMAQSWYQRCKKPDGTSLTFDGAGWSMKYNLAWDRVFDLGLFDDAFYDSETRSYLKHINAYGLPLDNRAVYTKSDWEMWCAALARDPEVRKAIIAPVAKYLRESPDRVAFSDWYYTDSGKHVQFIARSVQGGLFMPFLTK